MGFHNGMSAIEIRFRTSTGTHSLDGISQYMSAIGIKLRTLTGTHLLDEIL
jgi:hypothetical protein